jgi:hypothetical protein
MHQGNGQIDEPIQTIVKHHIAKKPFHFNIDATTRLAFYGDHYLHSFVMHQFSGQTGHQLNLV